MTQTLETQNYGSENNDKRVDKHFANFLSALFYCHMPRPQGTAA